MCIFFPKGWLGPCLQQNFSKLLEVTELSQARKVMQSVSQPQCTVLALPLDTVSAGQCCLPVCVCPLDDILSPVIAGLTFPLL